MKDLTILLVGAPNCGKSTLFYKLTHKRADIGNRAGVTVKESAGRISKKLFPNANNKGTKRWASEVTLVDLPGIYSLTPHTEDEAITVDRLTKTRFDMIINVLDSTALEAHLPLTLSLLRAFPKTPIIVAANMADELSDEGLSLDEGELSRSLDAPVIAVSAAKKKGLSQLCQKIAVLSEKSARARRRISAKSGDIAKKATKRSTSGATPRAETTSDRIDKLITSKPLGIPLFFLIFAAVFYISFGGIGARLTETFRESVIFPLQSILESVIEQNSSPPWLSSLINKGILTGLAAVLGFLPGVLLLSFSLALLEDSGYLSRAAFLFDAPMRRLGLNGRALIPVLLGFGCTVSAILSTRNLTSRRDKKLCSLFLPLISCSARSPLYLAFCATLLPNYPWLLCLLLYFLGIVCFLLAISLFSLFSGKQAPSGFVIELPKYRAPRPTVIFLKVVEQSMHFFKRAATVIFITSIVTWLASSFAIGYGYVDDPSNSILLKLSSAISPLFAPLGFDDPRLVASLIGGISAKESTLSSLCILFEMPSLSLSQLVLRGALTKQSALSFLVFFSLYTPCFPSMTAVYEENGRLSSLAVSVASCFAFAYACAFATYRIAQIFAL